MTTGNILPKKSLGQHWLKDPQSLESIARLADIKPTDLIVEIGPGLGDLTKLLAEQAKEVLAVEVDSQLISYLKFLNIPNLTLQNEDILKFNFSQLPTYKVVANIPYYLTGKIIKLLSELENRPALVVLLVQKEIAERLSAQPGQLSILGLTAQYFWNVEKGPMIPASKFIPPPKVDSMVVKLIPKDLDLSLAEQTELFRLIKIGFSSKRKTILNNLSSGLRIDKSRLKEFLEGANIDPNRRPQTLNLKEWSSIHKLNLK